VIECEGKKAVAATMRVYAKGKEVANARSNPNNGEFQLALPAGVKYDVVIETNRAVYAKNDTFLVDLTTLEIYEERDLTPYCIEKKDKVTVPIEKPQPKTIPILAPVYFDYDKYKLTAIAKAQLDSAFQILSAQKELRIELLGHTDAIGPDDYNQSLSENRLAAVEKYLIEKGLEQNRITSRIGKGKKAPIADNNTPEGRAVNRRVELMLK
jgi:outer membrane protein OmpA-like peptidoglycan-associated protein